MSHPAKNWIFLRGLTREKEHWDQFRPAFENQLQAKVHCIDFPGVGDFFQMKSPSTIPDITDDVIMQSSHIQEQSWILAHSMGCLVALEWMKREPHRFFGAVFINTSVRGISFPLKRLKPLGVLNFLKIGFGEKGRKKEELKFLLSSNRPDLKEDTIQKWMKIQHERPVTLETTFNQIKAAATYRAAKPRYPVLLLNSSGDQLVSPNCSVDIAHAWNLPLRTHPTSGHEITLDDPQWVIDQVKDWFKLSF